MVKKSWDYRKYNFRFYHITIKGVTWYLFKDGEQYFFSDDEPESGEPIDLPKDYEVKVDKITRKPKLVKIKSVDQSIDEFFADEADKKKEKTKPTSKKRRKLPSEMHDRYHRWKY